MKSYIAETTSGKLFDFLLADGPEDGWDCVQSTSSANPYWHHHKAWDPASDFFQGACFAQYIAGENTDGSFVMEDKVGWLVLTEGGSHLRDFQHLRDLHLINMRDPIVTIYDESLNAIAAKDFLKAQRTGNSVS